MNIDQPYPFVNSPVTSVDEAIERINALHSWLAPDDGMTPFNTMYLPVIQAIREATATAGYFTNTAFLDRLDVSFVNRYFDTYIRSATGMPLARCWDVVWQLRHSTHHVPLQFALAGMNAHISHDLPLAVVDTCVELGKAPLDESPEHHDFTRTNDVLAVAQEEIKGWFSTGVIATVDQLGGRVDDGFAAFGIHLARAGAWQTSEVLWELSANERLDRIFRQGLARSVEMASRGILL